MTTYWWEQDSHGGITLNLWEADVFIRDIYVNGEDAARLWQELDQCATVEKEHRLLEQWFDCIDPEF